MTFSKALRISKRLSLATDETYLVYEVPPWDTDQFGSHGYLNMDRVPFEAFAREEDLLCSVVAGEVNHF